VEVAPGGDLGAGGGLGHGEEGEVSASFLKKRSKKLLVLGGVGAGVPGPTGEEVFCFFFSKKKRLLSCFTLRD
jgi:hypothetical protein